MNIAGAAKLSLPLIVGLGAIAMIRPIMKMTGLMDLIGQQFGSILMTVLISLAWLIIVIMKKVTDPVRTLVLAGVAYALFAIIVSGVMSPILTGHLQGPLTNPFAFVSVFITNAIWGLIVGAIAQGIRKGRR
ncbi:hypothetical protein M3647_22170 [Paenibacillus cellulositrophicus]|uniref:hypothetical protein n=1 Tax=Paenibacillus cellulositrophicus TaxID=562959 RepID=UPI00203F8450|nr:hypothetical protein [Paenibacillus cellulositrophicus]MCM3000185.1 hypothetical protein [Paenibacillus cellulositrophicus]